MTMTAIIMSQPSADTSSISPTSSTAAVSETAVKDSKDGDTNAATSTASNDDLNQHRAGIIATARHEPAWQRFQTVLMIPTTTTAAARSQQQQQQPTSATAIHVYQRQYAHVYHQRLAALGPRCQQAWQCAVARQQQQQQDEQQAPTERLVTRVLELREQVESVVVGTLVKESDHHGGSAALLHPASRCRRSDALYLEDSSGRVALEFVQDHHEAGDGHGKKQRSPSSPIHHLHQFCTGMVVAVQGQVGTDGTLRVRHVYPPNLPAPLSAVSLLTSTGLPEVASRHDPWLLLLSGLQFGRVDADPYTATEVLLSFLQGEFGATQPRQICQVILAGGLLAPSLESTAAPASLSDKTDQKKAAALATANTRAALIELDVFCWRLAAVAGIPVDVLPGKDDPTTANWPQRPLHRSLLPSTAQFLNHSTGNSSSVYRTPNPYAARFCGGDRLVVGTDGTNIADLQMHLLEPVPQKQSDQNPMDDEPQGDSSAQNEQQDDDEQSNFQPVSALTALRRSLECGHICPTGPTSVPTMPHEDFDPMVLDHCPHVYFAGNTQHFATQLLWHANGQTSTVRQTQAQQHHADNEDDELDRNSNTLQRTPVRLICIPKFSETGEAVLVNLCTLQVQLLRFTQPQ